MQENREDHGNCLEGHSPKSCGKLSNVWIPQGLLALKKEEKTTSLAETIEGFGGKYNGRAP